MCNATDGRKDGICGKRPGGNAKAPNRPPGRGAAFCMKAVSRDRSKVSVRSRNLEGYWLGSAGAVATTLLWCVALALMLSGCSAGNSARGDVASSGKPATAGADNCLPAAYAMPSADPNEYRIQPGDQLAINFYLSPEFDDQVSVGPDGMLTLRLVGQVKAGGLTPAQVAQEIDKAYATELRAPDAVVEVKNMPARQVYVEGQVNHPGAFPLLSGTTALQAIAEAGGFTDDATDSNVVLIRRDACGNAQGSRLDLASAINHPGDGENAMLMPYDVLVVPRSHIANMDLFMKQYVQGLLPIPPYLAIPIP